MRNTYSNELNRAVSLLNFEQENRDKAKVVLNKKYKIPHYYLSLLAHKIFIRLSTVDFSFKSNKYASHWDQFHKIASEEVNALKLQH